MSRWTQEQVGVAQAVVGRLLEVQRSRKLSDKQLLDEYPDIGSTKTWRQRLLAGCWDAMHADRTLARLARVAVVLDGGLPDAVFYRDLPFVKDLMARLTLLERQTSDRRILVVLAPNGTGKTSVARWCVAQERSRRSYCRLRPAWRNKELHIANGMARALGSDDATSSAAEAEQRLVGMLSGQPRTVFLDQAHEGGPALMHLLRALVDETPSRFVYLGYDTAFRRVQTANTDALIEAQAFLGRCLKPVFDAYKGGIQQVDVTRYLERATGMTATAAGSVAKRVTPVLQRFTNLRLLADAIDSARAGSDEDEASADDIVVHVHGLAGLDPEAARKSLVDGDDEGKEAA